MRILLIESNKDASYNYTDCVTVIKPCISFNFHKYLNIGIRNSEAEYIALCNNDLLFDRYWLVEILKIKQKNPRFLSFSPIDYQYFGTPEEHFPSNVGYYEGYTIRTLLPGWCIVVARSVFDRIGYLDEQFDFYYADNDYSMTLRKYNIPHAMIPRSHVRHFGGQSSDSADLIDDQIDFRARYTNYNLPDHLYSDTNYHWILKNEKMVDGYMKFHSKWGSEIALRKKRALVKRFPFIQSYFSKIFW